MTRHVYTMPEHPPQNLEDVLLTLTARHDLALEAMRAADQPEIDPAVHRLAESEWLGARAAVLAAPADTARGFGFKARLLIGLGDDEVDKMLSDLLVFSGVRPIDEDADAEA